MDGKAEMERFLLERRRSQKTSLQRILRVKIIFHTVHIYIKLFRKLAGLKRQCPLQAEVQTPPDKGSPSLWDETTGGC